MIKRNELHVKLNWSFISSEACPVNSYFQAAIGYLYKPLLWQWWWQHLCCPRILFRFFDRFLHGLRWLLLVCNQWWSAIYCRLWLFWFGGEHGGCHPFIKNPLRLLICAAHSSRKRRGRQTITHRSRVGTCGQCIITCPRNPICMSLDNPDSINQAIKNIEAYLDTG